MHTESNLSQAQNPYRAQQSGASHESSSPLYRGGPLYHGSDLRGRPAEHSMRCANCDIEVLWPPTVVQGKVYCCTGCAAGGPCNCDYSQYRSVTISGVIHYTPVDPRLIKGEISEME